MTSINSIEKNSTATTPDYFKDCILACKISNQVHTNFEKRKVPQAASGNFVQKWLLFKTYVLYNICFFIGLCFFKNTFEIVHTYYRSFSRKIHIHMENLLNGYFYYSSFISDFLSKYFQELLFVAGERKIYKIYQRKLKLADKLWALEIAYLKLCICRQLFCIRQTSQFSQFYRVSLAELPNKLRG